MKMNKLYSVLAAFLLVGMSGCSYNDQPLIDRVDNLDNRLSRLEAQVQEMNTAITEIYTVIRALEEGDQIVALTPVEGGYEITFSKSGTLSIKDGKDGIDGTDGVTPVIAARKDLDGLFYWTLNGDFLLDEDGQKLPVTSHLTPRLRLNGDNFEISYDEGTSWEILGPAGSLPEGALLISKVTDSSDQVTFVLSDGQSLVIPKAKEFSLQIDLTSGAVKPGATSALIPYKLTGADVGSMVEAFATGGFEVVSVNYDIADDPKSGNVQVKVPSPMPENGKVFIFGINSKGVTVSKILRFEKGIFESAVDGNNVPCEGGTVTVWLRTNYAWELSIPEEARTWISQLSTKAVTEHILELKVAQNTGAERRVTLGIRRGIETLQTFEIIQEAAPVDDNSHKAPIEDWKDGGTVDL